MLGSSYRDVLKSYNICLYIHTYIHSLSAFGRKNLLVIVTAIIFTIVATHRELYFFYDLPLVVVVVVVSSLSSFSSAFH